ncbi:MAG: tetratricopeptide repeat protein [Bacteroidales bacterium]
MKKFILVAAALVFGFSSMSAQKGVDDGSKYGKGEDSIRCITNISLYVPYAKSQNYKDAYEFWKIVYDECPASSRDLYLYGARIMGWKIEHEKDAAKQKEYLDKLMEVYDKRIKYFGEDARYPKAWILGRKGLDYVTYAVQDPTKKQAYEWLKESVKGMNEKSELGVVQYFANLSYLLYKSDAAFRDQYIQDYMETSKVLEAMAEADPKDAKKIGKVKGDMDVMFAQSGAADCQTLQNIYAAKVEENKENLPWLQDALALMRKVRCQEIDAYFAASNYAHKIAPTAESAAGLAQQAIKDKNYSDAAKYLDEAISMEKENEAKGDFYYAAAQVLNQLNQYSKARQYALNAAELKPNFGAPYILIASMYAKSAPSIYPNDRVLQQVVYYAAVDKLEKARQVDPGVADDVNRMIGSYRAHFPKNEDIFMHGDLEKGKPFTVGGWIGERTTIR